MECVVCQNFYNADTMVPRVLSCGHSFCSVCVKLMLDHAKGCTLVCIVCRLPHYALVTSPLQVPYNFALLDIMFGSGNRSGGANRGMRGGGSTRGAAPHGRGIATRGRGAVPGVSGAVPGVSGAVPGGAGAAPGGAGAAPGGAGAAPGGAGAAPGGPLSVSVAEVPLWQGGGQGLLQLVPASGPPALVTHHGLVGASPMPMSIQGPAGGFLEVPGVPPPMSPIGQACGGSAHSPVGNSSVTSSSSSDEGECPNRNRQLNAPKPIGDKFRVTLQQSPGMIWFGGRLRDGNKEEFASKQDTQKSGGKKKNGRNKKRNGNRGRGGPGSSSQRDPEEDAIFDYLPILGPRPR